MTDRREVDHEKLNTRRFNRLLILCVLILASVLLTFSYVWWERDKQESINKYLNCVSLIVQGVKEPSCEPYEAWISRNTNVKP